MAEQLFIMFQTTGTRQVLSRKALKATEAGALIMMKLVPITERNHPAVLKIQDRIKFGGVTLASH